MSLDIENTGYCVFGACPDGLPTDKGIAFPPAAGKCKVKIKYKSKAKTHKSTGSGKSGANTTFTGKEVGKIELEIKWLDIEPTSTQVELALKLLSTAGPNAGKAWDWTERWASIHEAGAIMVEDVDGPEPIEGTDEVSCKLECSTWTKPTNSGAGTGVTPKKPQKFFDANEPKGAAPGSVGAAFKDPNAPKVSP